MQALLLWSTLRVSSLSLCRGSPECSFPQARGQRLQESHLGTQRKRLNPEASQKLLADGCPKEAEEVPIILGHHMIHQKSSWHSQNSRHISKKNSELKLWGSCFWKNLVCWKSAMWFHDLGFAERLVPEARGQQLFLGRLTGDCAGKLIQNGELVTSQLLFELPRCSSRSSLWIPPLV